MTPDATLILRAFHLCVEAHKDQLDRDGYPHVFHAVRVAEKQTTAERVVIGLLHDVVEDTDVPLSRIESEFGQSIADVVWCLTRGKEESWSEYIKRVLLSEDAMWVKKADLEDNTRVERVDLRAAERMPMYKDAHQKIVAKLNGN